MNHVAHPTHHLFKDITGHKFHRWTVQGFTGMEKGRTTWECLCDCGTTKKVNGCNLRNGESMSCGCLVVDTQRSRLTTHGESKNDKQTPEYRTWSDIFGRCLNPKNRSFGNYGGRGIGICDKWRSYDEFLSDMGRRPTAKHTLDRKNNSKGYGPDNCRWATKAQQSQNMRSNRMMTLDGKTLCVAEWAEITGIKIGVIRGRLNRGWDDEKSLTTPTAIYTKRKLL